MNACALIAEGPFRILLHQPELSAAHRRKPEIDAQAVAATLILAVSRPDPCRVQDYTFCISEVEYKKDGWSDRL